MKIDVLVAGDSWRRTGAEALVNDCIRSFGAADILLEIVEDGCNQSGTEVLSWPGVC